MPNVSPQDAAKVVQIAGGEIVGRTRLQKIACILQLAGAELGFHFDYHLFGPYSEGLTTATADAKALGLLTVENKVASWGGKYSIFSASHELPNVPQSLKEIGQIAASADSIELELAVTAAFLAKNGILTPWEEVASRKKAKATPQRLAGARALYAKLAAVDTPVPLPQV